MQLRPIETEADHHAALREIEQLWDAEEGTPEGDRLELLTKLVETYEGANYPMNMPELD